MAAEGLSNNRIAKQLPVSRPTILLWRQRFAKLGPSGLTEIQKGRGRPPRIGPEKVESIVDMTLHTSPKGATHWSCRIMARHCGLNPATVQRIWDAHGLQPHRFRHFKLSRDPRFVEKLTDVVGLYLNPPDKALVVRVDEESQIQAAGPKPTRPTHEERALWDLDSQLQTPWNHHAVCCPEPAGRNRHRRLHAASPQPGVLEVPPPPRKGIPRTGPASDPRQLPDPQAPQRETMASHPAPLPSALYPHQRLLAQFDRALVC